MNDNLPADDVNEMVPNASEPSADVSDPAPMEGAPAANQESAIEPAAPVPAPESNAAPFGSDAGEDDAQRAFFARHFAIPGSPESSKDGRWLAYLLANETDELELWLTSTTDGESRRLDLPFTPLEDRDRETGRLIRGPQWSPDGTRLALAGLHPDGDRSAVWIVPTGVGGEEPAPEPADEPTVDLTEKADTPDDAANENVIAADAPEASDVPEDPAEPTDDSAPADEPAEDNAPADAMPAAASEPPAAPEPPYLLIDHQIADRSPRWNLDGELIAMVSTIDGRDIITLIPVQDPTHENVEMLSWSHRHDSEPVWSRDGKFLAFLRERPESTAHHDIMCWAMETGSLVNLTSEKEGAIRHSLEWVPGRNLIAYVTLDGEWLSISVINADNKAGWTVTREAGDKTEPRFAQHEARLAYLRTEGFTTVLCERSLHSSAAVALDPGEGVARYPRWLDGKRVSYGFAAPQKPFGFFVQENNIRAERLPVALPTQGEVGTQNLRLPEPLEFEVAPEETFSGMLYRTRGTAGKVASIVYLPDGPLTTRRGEFQIEEQALASVSLPVFTPVVHGASGFGAGIENDLIELAESELEDMDIAEAAIALGNLEGNDPSRVAVVGVGFGGTLALVAAGARTDVFAAAVAIDPITDWSSELKACDSVWRNWVTSRFGLPLTNAGAYALRTPATFSAVIDIPMLLVRTANAPDYRKAQFDLFTEDLDELGIVYEVLDVPAEPLPVTLRRVAQEVSRRLMDGRSEADTVADLSAEDLD